MKLLIIQKISKEKLLLQMNGKKSLIQKLGMCIITIKQLSVRHGISLIKTYDNQIRKKYVGGRGASIDV